jgi:hypothetical protein
MVSRSIMVSLYPALRILARRNPTTARESALPATIASREGIHVDHAQELERRVHRWDWLRRNPVTHWCVLFVVLAAALPLHGNNANPYARFATLAALAEDHSLAMDAYRDSTCDWARTPDGRYYSNKAPGPTLLAAPIYLAIDQVAVDHAQDRPARDRQRLAMRDGVLDVLALLLQAIPFALVVLVAAQRLVTLGASRAAVELAALAMLFGNTAALLMNMFYGHGMAALFTLMLVLALIDGKMTLTGLLFGLNVLTDYGSALLLPVVVAILVWQARRGRRSVWGGLARFALGGLGPLLVFAAYHTHCFGGPLTLPNKYQNPIFVQPGLRAAWGVIDFLPSARWIDELLLGGKRGLLVTQPWVLLFPVLLAVHLLSKQRRGVQRWPTAGILAAFGLGGLFVLFWMNASFGGWHGGVSPGPRYLSAILPTVALAMGLCYDMFPRPARALLWLALLPALVLFVIVWSTDVAIWPDRGLWAQCWESVTNHVPERTLGRLTWALLAVAATSVVAAVRAYLAHRSRFSTPG